MTDAVLDPYAALVAAHPVAEAAVRDMCTFVDSRQDCADFRVAVLLKLLLATPDALDDGLRARLKLSLLGFKYWMDEPGADSMCQWSENHQALFAAEEFLVGQIYFADKFANGLLGEQRKERGRERLTRWLSYRFEHGFSEWHSPTYYLEDAAALALVIDHADDDLLVERARMVMDLLLLDMALNHHDGRLVGPSGRCYADEKLDPSRADVAPLLATHFGASVPDLEPLDLAAVACASRRYTCPPAIRRIARAEGTWVTRQSTGLDAAEVAGVMADPDDIETTAAYLWGMEAFTTPASIRVTLKAFRAWRLQDNAFLRPLAPLAKVARLLRLERTPLLPWLVRLLNPVTQGMAIERANIYGFHTPSYHLGSAVHHHPGGFGDQQHLWQASLPGGISVFATHPGAAVFDEATRNQTPSHWVGNGRNPEIGQHENVLVALYDTRGRRGYLERDRATFTHLHFPFASLDETRLGPTWVTGRAGDAFIGVRSLENLEMVSGNELVQRGEVTGYAVLMGDRLDYRDLADFTEVVKGSPLRLRGDKLEFATPQGRFDVRWRRGFSRNGKPVCHDFPRYEAPWLHTARRPERIDVEVGDARLSLHFGDGRREVVDG